MTLALLLIAAVAAAPRGWAEPREPFHVVATALPHGIATGTGSLAKAGG